MHDKEALASGRPHSSFFYMHVFVAYDHGCQISNIRVMGVDSFGEGPRYKL